MPIHGATSLIHVQISVSVLPPVHVPPPVPPVVPLHVPGLPHAAHLPVVLEAPLLCGMDSSLELTVKSKM